MTETPEEVHRRYVAEKLEDILTQVRATNGRVRSAEIAIVVLQWGYALGAFVAAAWFFSLKP